MSIRITTIGLLLLGQLGCSKDDFDLPSFQDDASITSLNGTWKVNSFENFNTGEVEYKSQENSWSLDITVSFDDTHNPKAISGINTTNSIAGEFNYTGQRQFKVSNLLSTFVGQPKWADMFAEAVLDDSPTFRINPNSLRIYYAGETKSVTLVKE